MTPTAAAAIRVIHVPRVSLLERGGVCMCVCLCKCLRVQCLIVFFQLVLATLDVKVVIFAICSSHVAKIR